MEEIDARYNWWGKARGPYHKITNPNGEDTGVTESIIIDPWYTSESGELSNANRDGSNDENDEDDELVNTLILMLQIMMMFILSIILICVVFATFQKK